MSRSWSYAKHIFALEFEDTMEFLGFKVWRAMYFTILVTFCCFELLYCLIGTLWTNIFFFYSGLVVSRLISEQSGKEGGDTVVDLKIFIQILCIGAHSEKSTPWICDVVISVQNNYVVSVPTFISLFAIRVYPHWKHLTSLLLLQLSKLVFEKKNNTRVLK